MSQNRRKHQRFEIVAQVQLGADGDVLIYQAGNLSLGGVFVNVKLEEVPFLAVGAVLDVTITGMAVGASSGDAEQPPEHVVTAKAKIVRVDERAPGLALEFKPLSPQALTAVKALISAGKPVT